MFKITKKLVNNCTKKLENVTKKTKEKIINKLNTKRSDPPDYSKQKIVYVKTKSRDKKLPKFKATKLIKNKNVLIKTNKGTYHKSIARKPKSNKKQLLQDTDEHEDLDDLPGPSGTSNDL